MGVLPLQFPAGQSASSLGITGAEVFSITGLAEAMASGNGCPEEVEVRAWLEDAALDPAAGSLSASARERTIDFRARVRIDTPKEAEYYRHGGILRYVLRQLLEA
jgi:aconitate hydratase